MNVCLDFPMRKCYNKAINQEKPSLPLHRNGGKGIEMKALSADIIDILKVERNYCGTFATENIYYHVFSCRKSGECLFENETESFRVRKGDITYISAGSSYQQTDHYDVLYCIHFSVSENIPLTMRKFTFDDPDYICGLFERAETLWRTKESNYYYLCLGILYTIIGLTGAFAESEEQTVPAALAPAVDYINNHIYEPDFSLGSAIHHAGISRAYFNRLFRSCFHSTPMEYIITKRINRAKQLIRAGNNSNEEIAALCGFNNVEYFYMVFKKTTGRTTKEYKKDRELL